MVTSISKKSPNTFKKWFLNSFFCKYIISLNYYFNTLFHRCDMTETLLIRRKTKVDQSIKSVNQSINQSIIVQRSTGRPHHCMSFKGFARLMVLRKEGSLSCHTCCFTWIGMTVWLVLFERSSRISHPPVFFKLRNEYI